MLRINIFLLLSISMAAAETRDTVVLLHGLGRTSASMSRLAAALEREGYRVINATYPSRTQPIETLAREWLPAQLQSHSPKPVDERRQVAPVSDGRPEGTVPSPRLEPTPGRIHFVTHSMGGIIVRLWLREQGVPPNPGRVVMLAPPNAGSEVSDRLESFAPFRWFTGQNGRRLGTGPDSLPRSLGDWPAAAGDLGIIAGDFVLNPLLAAWLPGPSDGKVTVASTHLAGERDHLVLPYSHTWLGYRRETIAQVIAFLREGKFVPRPRP